MKDTVVAIIRFGKVPYERYTLPFIEDWCKRCGYRLELCRPVVGREEGRPPGWDKLILPGLFGAEWSILMDLDMMPAPWAGGLEFLMEEPTLAIAKDLPKRRRHRASLRRADACIEAHKFNAGLIVAHASRYDWLRNVYDKADWRHWLNHGFAYEQQEVNERIRSDGVDLTVIPNKWNRMQRKGLPRKKRLFKRYTQIWHLAGARNNRGRIARAKVVKRYYDFTVRRAEQDESLHRV